MVPDGVAPQEKKENPFFFWRARKGETIVLNSIQIFQKLFIAVNNGYRQRIATNRDSKEALTVTNHLGVKV